MRERGILFTAPNVRSILAGTKSQTRRVVKCQYSGLPLMVGGSVAFLDKGRRTGPDQRCPYGVPGERLWVRENGWQRPIRTAHEMREGADTWKPYYYDADTITDADVADFKRWGFKRRPSIHMPRWACRITLEITDVRVERLQEISEADAIAEGIERAGDDWRNYGNPMDVCLLPRTSYATLWASINGAGSWDANPWVWAISFRRVGDA